jgi:hypothetical protein
VHGRRLELLADVFVADHQLLGVDAVEQVQPVAARMHGHLAVAVDEGAAFVADADAADHVAGGVDP